MGIDRIPGNAAPPSLPAVVPEIAIYVAVPDTFITGTMISTTIWL
jgi:hypothetical protein